MEGDIVALLQYNTTPNVLVFFGRVARGAVAAAAAMASFLLENPLPNQRETRT